MVSLLVRERVCWQSLEVGEIDGRLSRVRVRPLVVRRCHLAALGTSRQVMSVFIKRSLENVKVDKCSEILECRCRKNSYSEKQVLMKIRVFPSLVLQFLFETQYIVRLCMNMGDQWGGCTTQCVTCSGCGVCGLLGTFLRGGRCSARTVSARRRDRHTRTTRRARARGTTGEIY